MTQTEKTNLFGFKIIGAFKLISAGMLIAMGIGIFKLMNRDIADVLTNLVAMFRLDPGNHMIHGAISQVAGIDHKQLRALGVGTFFYAFLHIVEGAGLLLEKRWAGFVTVFVTGSLLPIEAYELVKKVDNLRISAVVINIAIVVYLLFKLRQEMREHARADAAAAAAKSSPE